MTKQIVLERSYDPEIYKFCSSNTSSIWKGKLSSNQYVSRDVILQSTSKVLQLDPNEQKGVYLYVLRDYSIPSFTKFDNIVAHAETLNRESFRINGKTNEITKVISSVIGNVFTLEQHRKKGYANHLITQLNDILDSQCGDDGYSYLYSEVGDYYQKFGYDNFHVSTHYFPIEGVKGLDVDSKGFRYLGYDGFNYLIQVQLETTKQRLLQKGKDLKSNESIISLVPNIDTYSWHHDRDLISSSYLQPDVEIKNFGAVLTGSKDHIIWYHDWSESKLVILKIFIEEESEQGLLNFQRLLQIAISEAKQFKLNGIFLWDSSLGESKQFHDSNIQLLQGFQGAKLFGENDSLSAIRFHDKTFNDLVFWDSNEKWAWF